MGRHTANDKKMAQNREKMRTKLNVLNFILVLYSRPLKRAPKKILSEKNQSPFIPRYAGIRRISTKENKIDPHKPYVHGKHLESILGICKNRAKKCIQFE